MPKKPMNRIEVEAAVERILKLAARHKADFHDKDGINWGNLHCVDAVRVITGSEYDWLIDIEEVSPDSYHFREFVEAELARRGVRARVITEW